VAKFAQPPRLRRREERDRALAAFAIGAMAGMLIRPDVPATTVTLTVLAALRIARQTQAARRTPSWPKVCICGERHQLLFTTSTGQPIEPRNLKRSFDARCAKAGVRQIKIHDTRRTCGSLLAALDVHPRVAMAILRHSRIALTMDIFTRVPDKTAKEALKRLSDWLDTPRSEAAS
jgi:integrase